MKVEDAAANLATGVAGTLVAALAVLDIEPSDRLPRLEPTIEMLIAGAKPAPNGIFWDFNPTSFKPPVGFVGGTAGIDYCLAHLRRHLNVSYDALLAGSLAYANSTFDEQFGNWPDQDSTVQFRHIRRPDMEKSMLDGTTDKLAASIKVDDSISWGVGTLGILKARALVAKTCPNTYLGEIARADCTRAIARLNGVSADELAGLDSSIFTGLTGLTLALDSCSEAAFQLPESVANLINLAYLKYNGNIILSHYYPIIRYRYLTMLRAGC